jgi:hypothetical protein
MKKLFIAFLAIGSFSVSAKDLIKKVKFHGNYIENGEKCWIQANGNGETWLRGDNFNWIWSSRSTHNSYEGIGEVGTVVSNKDIGKKIQLLIDSKGRATRFTVEYFKSVKTCVIKP